MANTFAPLSETGIANMAAQVLDDIQLNSLDDPTPFGRFVAREFGYIRDEQLRLHPWTCVRRRALLAADSAAPDFGWTSAYTLPADCLRVFQLRQLGQWNKPCLVPYEVESRKILTDLTGPLPIIYTARPTNIASLDPLLARALGMRIALMAATRVTGKMQYFAKTQQLYAEAQREAIMSNDLEMGPQEFVYSDEGYSQHSILAARGANVS